MIVIIDRIFKDFVDTIDTMKFLGSSKITGKGNIRLIKDVADRLKAQDGDHILFYEDGENIIIKKA